MRAVEHADMPAIVGRGCRRSSGADAGVPAGASTGSATSRLSPPGRRMVGSVIWTVLRLPSLSIVTAPAIFERSRPANLRIVPATAPPGTACRICLIWRPTSSALNSAFWETAAG
jgi:hypothetical protein